LGGRKGIRPVKTDWWGAGMVICLQLSADLHTAQLMPLPLTLLPLNGCVCTAIHKQIKKQKLVKSISLTAFADQNQELVEGHSLQLS